MSRNEFGCTSLLVAEAKRRMGERKGTVRSSGSSSILHRCEGHSEVSKIRNGRRLIKRGVQVFCLLRYEESSVHVLLSTSVGPCSPRVVRSTKMRIAEDLSLVLLPRSVIDDPKYSIKHGLDCFTAGMSALAVSNKHRKRSTLDAVDQ